MLLGISMMVISFIIIPLEKLDKTIPETSVQIFVPMLGFLLLLLSFPVILQRKKWKNLKT